jgi:cytochrome c-type biogenesis protein CcmH
VKTPRKSLATAAAAALIAVVALVALPATQAAAGVTPRTTLPIIQRQVMCVTCKIPLEVAESPQADLERAYIQGLINQGLGEAEIKRNLVAQYGPTVLAMPSTHGFDLAAYLVPLAVVLALIATVLALLPGWRRHARERAAVVSTDRSLSPADTARLDSDLARFD